MRVRWNEAGLLNESGIVYKNTLTIFFVEEKLKVGER